MSTFEPCARPAGCATPFACSGDTGDYGTCIYRALQEHEERVKAGTVRPIRVIHPYKAKDAAG
jgi:hypothetical protein